MPKLRERGGGPAVGLANEYTNFLSNMLWGRGQNGGGNYGADGLARVMSGLKGRNGESVMSGGGGGISGIYGDLLSAGAGRVGGAFDTLLQRDLESARQGILTQFANIGGGQSSGAAQALSRFNAEAAPRATLGIANLQMEAMRPLLESLYGISQRGITQRQLVQEYSPIENVINTASQLGSTIAQFAAPGVANIASQLDVGGYMPKTPSAPGTDKTTGGVSLTSGGGGYGGHMGFGLDPSAIAQGISRELMPQFGFRPR